MKKYSCILPSLLALLIMVSFAHAGERETMSDSVKRRMNRAAMIPDALQNPGFEGAGTTGQLSGWTAVAHAGNSYRIVQDKNQAFGGKYSLEIENTGEPEWGGVFQVFRAEGLAGKEVELSAHLKMQGVTAPGFNMMLKITQMGRELNSVKIHSQFTGDSDWKTVRLVARLPKETTHLEVVLTLEGDGRLWVDDVRVAPLAEGK